MSVRLNDGMVARKCRIKVPDETFCLPAIDGVLSSRANFYGQNIVVHQAGPRVVDVRWSETSFSRKPYVYETRRIELPYIITRIAIIPCTGNLQSLRVLFAKEPVTGPNSKLYRPSLPNVRYDGVACIGGEVEVKEYSPELVMRDFWNRGFNKDIGIACSYYGRADFCTPPIEINTIRRWERNTRKNPGFATEIDYSYYGTYREILGKF